MIIDRKISSNGQDRPVMYEKTATAVDLVINHDVDPKTALTLARGSVPARSTVREFVKKTSKMSLQSPSMLKLACKAVKDTLQGKEYGYEAVKIFSNGTKVPYVEKIVPNYTNKLAAATMIYDRAEPIIHRNENRNINTDISVVDLEKYMNRK